MNVLRKTLLTGATAVAATIGVAATAVAVTATIGNDAIIRPNLTGFENFTVVDTNRPAPFDGYLDSITYYAARVGTIPSGEDDYALRFLMVDTHDVVTWVSDEVVPDSVGVHTLPLDEPVGVTVGSNLAVYFKYAGVVPYSFDLGAGTAKYEADNAGLPEVGDTLEYIPDEWRNYFYSMNAQITAASPDICKDGGWESYGYANQGQCIASVVANDRAGKE